MNREQQTLQLRLAILRTLADCGAYLVPEPTLHLDINLLLVPPAADVEFLAALHWLESEKMIVSCRPELGGPLKWKITDLGRTAAIGA